MVYPPLDSEKNISQTKNNASLAGYPMPNACMPAAALFNKALRHPLHIKDNEELYYFTNIFYKYSEAIIFFT